MALLRTWRGSHTSKVGQKKTVVLCSSDTAQQTGCATDARRAGSLHTRHCYLLRKCAYYICSSRAGVGNTDVLSLFISAAVMQMPSSVMLLSFSLTGSCPRVIITSPFQFVPTDLM